MRLSERYKFNFEKWCIQLLVEAYELSILEEVIQLNWDENDISQELFEKIDNNPFRLKRSITVSREFYLTKEINKVKGFANKLPRIDFRMTSINNRLEYRYFCEAKRLKEKEDSNLKREYIQEGMNRFISEKYPIGCILGYLLEGNPDNTKNGINSLLKKYNRDTEILHSKSHDLVAFYYESTHPTIGMMKHLIFDFTKIAKN